MSPCPSCRCEERSIAVNLAEIDSISNLLQANISILALAKNIERQSRISTKATQKSNFLALLGGFIILERGVDMFALRTRYVPCGTRYILRIRYAPYGCEAVAYASSSSITLPSAPGRLSPRTRASVGASSTRLAKGSFAPGRKEGPAARNTGQGPFSGR